MALFLAFLLIPAFAVFSGSTTAPISESVRHPTPQSPKRKQGIQTVDAGSKKTETSQVTSVRNGVNEDEAQKRESIEVESFKHQTKYELRIWTAGKFKQEAGYWSRNGKTVTLELPNGKTIKIELDKLSTEDQKYIHDRQYKNK